MFSVLWMQLFRYSTSIYGGSDVLIGASWDLLKWFVVAGVVVIVLHAAVKAITADRSGAVTPLGKARQMERTRAVGQERE
jgi:hypothetical protein